MRLKNIQVNEVSLVDKGANKKKFYFAKREEVVKAEVAAEVKTETKVEEAKVEIKTEVAETKTNVEEKKVVQEPVDEFDTEDYESIKLLSTCVKTLEEQISNLNC